VRRALSLLAWFAVLEGLWAVFVGTRQGIELVAGLIAAAAGATLAELLRSLGLEAYRIDLRLVADAWKLPVNVVFDFGVLTWVLARSLARGRRVRGEWVTVPSRTVGGWQRAFGAIAGTASPNAIVVDVDGERALLHALEPNVHTAKSVP
jgi:multisubunit Na+/H+ antiporter MnhE subunit